MSRPVELTEAQCRFVWNESTPCARAIPQRFVRTAPETGAAIKAEVKFNDLLAAPSAYGQAENEMARLHIAPAFRNFLAPTIDILSEAEGGARSGLAKTMGDAVASLTSISSDIPAMSFLLGEASYAAYVAEFVQAAFTRIDMSGVVFAGRPVFCLPGLLKDVAFLPGGLVLECGPAVISTNLVDDTREFSQKVKLELDSTRVVCWKGL